jgi:ketosteroid isomerase-like protein
MQSKIIVAVLLIVFIGCSEQKVDTKREGEKLMQLSREWSKSASTDSLEKTISYWADDAVFMSSGQPTLNGKKEIRGMVERSAKIPGFNISWEPLSVSVSESGDMAYMIEQNQITMNDSLGRPIVKYGKGVTIWKKDDKGAWKNVVEVAIEDPTQKQ